jgi:hypothetical protein
MAALALSLGVARVALAGEAGTEELFARSVRELHEGRANEAVADFEALADRGVVDATASYDRGLAYAMRVRIGAEQPGDLGRAAHGFEESRDLTRDSRLASDAARALLVVRSEVARRRVAAGQPVQVDPGRSFGRAVADLLSEDTWAGLAIASAVTLSLGLFARWLSRAARSRIAGGVTAGVAAPVLVFAMVMTFATRRDRLTLREAVVVSPTARPTDERGISLPGAQPLPEGARVELVDARGGQIRVRFGTTDAWVADSSLRDLSRPD